MGIIPPLLSTHITELKNEHSIDIIENDTEIFIIFNNYPVPDDIWDRNMTNLLIISYPTYPNAKIDMFWVEPHLKLRTGGIPKAANTFENKLSKNWQRFSWHVNDWNPAKDNLKTFLNDVNERLSKSDTE